MIYNELRMKWSAAYYNRRKFLGMHNQQWSESAITHKSSLQFAPYITLMMEQVTGIHFTYDGIYSRLHPKAFPLLPTPPTSPPPRGTRPSVAAFWLGGQISTVKSNPNNLLTQVCYGMVDKHWSKRNLICPCMAQICHCRCYENTLGLFENKAMHT